MMCQTTDGANCEDGVAPEGALHLSEGDAKERDWPSLQLSEAYYQALLTIASYPITLTKPPENMDAFNMQLIAQGALEGFTVSQPRSPIEEATSVADTVPAASEQGESPDGDRAVVNEAAGASSPFGLPSLSQEFTPCAIELDEARITEMVLKDCFMIWEPWGNDGVEFGYDAEGSLQAIRIPDLVAGHKVLRERDTRPKDGDPSGAPLASSPVPEGNSPDASLTPQNLEARAKETWLKIYETSIIMVHPDDAARYVSIILHALREERERAAKIAESNKPEAAPADWNWQGGYETACATIAAAIRGDSNGC